MSLCAEERYTTWACLTSCTQVLCNVEVLEVECERNAAVDLVALSAVMTGLSVNAMNGEIVVLHSTKNCATQEEGLNPCLQTVQLSWTIFLATYHEIPSAGNLIYVCVCSLLQGHHGTQGAAEGPVGLADR